jgi:ketosteroid isomerase-like protein
MTDLAQLDQDFFDVLTAGDVGRLGELLTDDFLIVDINSGSVATKADLVGAVTSGALTFPAIEAFPAEAVVRQYGDVAIIVGRTGMNFTTDDGATFSAGSRYTHVWVVDPAGRWQLASAQGTQITAQ